jgi:ABC-type siderophore export system fused ATPase/permease subunit
MSESTESVIINSSKNIQLVKMYFMVCLHFDHHISCALFQSHVIALFSPSCLCNSGPLHNVFFYLPKLCSVAQAAQPQVAGQLVFQD